MSENQEVDVEEVVEGPVIKNKTKRCPKGERRIILPNGEPGCIKITKDQANKNKTRKEKLAEKKGPAIPLVNPPRCPKGERKFYLKPDKSEWTCRPIAEEEKKVNEKKKQNYDQKRNQGPAPQIVIKRKPSRIVLEVDEEEDEEEEEEEEEEDEYTRMDTESMSKNNKEKESHWQKQLITMKGQKNKSNRRNDTTDGFKEEDLERLYPDLDSPDFSQKIAQRQEFAQNVYDPQIYNVQTRAEKLCNLPLEFHPYQVFVKHFLSPHSPYNGLLLYHGLGTGKTLTAVGVCEEMRHYMKSIGQRKHIYVISSHNISQNFKQALFDINALPDDLSQLSPESLPVYMAAILREINPTMKFPSTMTKDQLKSIVRKLLKNHYHFMGYTKLGLEISALRQGSEESFRRQIQNRFSDTLMVIDEVHNIRHHSESGGEINDKRDKIGKLIEEVVQYSKNMRLLLMSATPVFDSPLEIVQIANLLNANDKRKTIRRRDVFHIKDNPEEGIYEGDFISEENKGKDLLREKLNGYVSFIRGENPYSFPFRIYPHLFEKSKTFALTQPNKYEDEFYPDDEAIPYPIIAFDGTEITPENRLKYTCLYVDPLSNYQKGVYENMVKSMMESEKINKRQVFSWGRWVQCLNITFPDEQTGDEGFSATMNIEKSNQEEKYSYQNNIEKIFSQALLGTYSAKMASILTCIERGVGICLIYSQYLYSGVTSMALALEEAGYSRYKKDNLLQNGSYKGESKGNYILITGKNQLTVEMMEVVRSEANKNGEEIRVILISEAGSEGIDFKNIRQVHIMEPWYNLNRMEQIVGRAIRYKSHCSLPFAQRNVEIYLHTAYAGSSSSIETMDAYIYRVYAEPKAIQIGRVNRLLKQTAVDVHLNVGQMNMTVADLQKISENINITLELSSSGMEIVNYPMGDKPYTAVCDYEEDCKYTLNNDDEDIGEIRVETFETDHVRTLRPILMQRIQELFKEYDFLNMKEIISFLNHGTRVYALDEIYDVLSYLIKHPHEMWKNRNQKWGFLVEKGNVFLFQPQDSGKETKQSVAQMSVEITREDPVVVEEAFEPLIQGWENRVSTLFQENSSSSSSSNSSDSFQKFDVWLQEWTKVYTNTKTQEKIQILKLVLSVFTREQVEKVLLHRFIETLNYSDKATLLVYSFKDPKRHRKIIEYFQNNCSFNTNNNKPVYVLFDLEDNELKTRWHFFEKNKDNLEEAEGLDQQKLMELYHEYPFQLAPSIGGLDRQTEKNIVSYSLKLKKTSSNTNYYTGKFCTTHAKEELSVFLKDLNIQKMLEKIKIKGLFEDFPLLRYGQCFLIEIFMRLKEDENRYFLSPEIFHKSELKKLVLRKK